MFVRKHIEELKYPLGNGSTNPIMGTINGLPYAIKTINNEQGNKTLVNELVAHMIIKKLELNIPNCEIAYIDNATYIDNNVSINDWFTEKCYGLAFCSEFNPRTMVISSEKMIMLAKNAKWIIPKLLLLDHLLYNKDRNKGNVLLTTFKDNKELLLIDHTHIFNLETIWNSTGLKRKIEEEDYKDDWIMRSNSYLYSKFLKANPINLIDMKGWLYMAKIMVDPTKLELVASKIEEQAADYSKLYQQLFTEVEAMGKAWQGADNIAYTTQIEGFREDLNKIKQVLDEYSSFLRQSAKVYKSTQDEVISKAKTLTNK